MRDKIQSLKGTKIDTSFKIKADKVRRNQLK